MNLESRRAAVIIVETLCLHFGPKCYVSLETHCTTLLLWLRRTFDHTCSEKDLVYLFSAQLSANLD